MYRSPVHLEYKDLRLSVSVPARPRTWCEVLTFRDAKQMDKEILHGLNGGARAGEVHAILGPSGSGKTSLLNTLAQRTKSVPEGMITLNGVPQTKKMKHLVGYVMQKDIFFSNLTVQETLRSTADLRLPRTMTKDERIQRVDEIVSMLGMEKCLHTDVGGDFHRGISGGELKRLNVANELLGTPRIFLLDEPTSGLDSTIAYSLIQSLKDIAAETQMTIVMSIHQPSSQTFELFDRVSFLCDGSIAYMGSGAEVYPYFTHIGYPCPSGYNIADHVMDVISDPKSQPHILECYNQNMRRMQGGLYGMDFPGGSVRAYEDGIGKENSIVTLFTPDDMTVNDIVLQKADLEPSWFSKLLTLTGRGSKVSLRGILSFADIVQSIGVAVIGAFVWFQVMDSPYEDNLIDRVGLIMFICAYYMFQSAFRGLTSFPPERNVVSKERESTTYPVSNYFVSKTLTDLPQTLITQTILYVLLFPMVGFPWGFTDIVGTWAFLVMEAMIAQTIGVLVSTVVSTMSGGTAFISVFLLAHLLLAGFYTTEYPKGIEQMTYLSFLEYSVAGVMGLNFLDREIECASESMYTACNTGDVIPGSDVMSEYNKVLLPWQNYLVLIGFYTMYRFLLFLSLQYGKQMRLQH